MKMVDHNLGVFVATNIERFHHPVKSAAHWRGVSHPRLDETPDLNRLCVSGIPKQLIIYSLG